MFEEFKGLTNAQVYRKAFHELLMLPDPTDPRRFLGNSQREDFLPHLTASLSKYGNQKCTRILDVGAGSGEVVDLILHTVPEGVISIEEPNPLLLDRYKERVRAYANLRLVKFIRGRYRISRSLRKGARGFRSFPGSM